MFDEFYPIEDRLRVTNPHWRRNYVPPIEILETYGVSINPSMAKAIEISLKYEGELVDRRVAYRIKHELLEFLGDRDLVVFVENEKIIVKFDDDDGYRKVVTLGG